ncbi:hypothetical protein [Cyclobacterium jeungdonense]|uniref:CHAD domain-containing protein n=1 Tax=Cyclobacterium jeungdonense TaxID=708087 RepID=A0ABT8C593_9BACT|nr:hypothetical protein [Cyclobacterium jeungdonense]MDN3686788.1 hypothetical protein [Cyclobacterium jeungdonense]
MESTLPFIMQVFDRHFDAGKSVFSELSKKIKSRKALELQDELFFFKLFLQVLEKIHFKNKHQVAQTFTPFKYLNKNLRKVQHIRMITDGFENYFGEKSADYGDYEKQIAQNKKEVYTQVYEIILSITLKDWENLYHQVRHFSEGLSVLTINTATTQIINEEIDFFYFDTKSRLDPQTIHDIFNGLKRVTALEKVRLSIGLNSIFTDKVHQQITELSQQMEGWQRNQLLLQHFGSFLGQKEKVSKKYQLVLTQIQKDHKEMTQSVAERCRELFTKMLH